MELERQHVENMLDVRDRGVEWNSQISVELVHEIGKLFGSLMQVVYDASPGDASTGGGTSWERSRLGGSAFGAASHNANAMVVEVSGKG